MPASCALTAFLLFAVPAICSLQTLPALLWGSGDYINHPSQQLGLQASYEVGSMGLSTPWANRDLRLWQDALIFALRYSSYAYSVAYLNRSIDGALAVLASQPLNFPLAGLLFGLSDRWRVRLFKEGIYDQ